MPDDAPDRLINCPTSLQLVPLLPIDFEVRLLRLLHIQVLLLLDNSGVIDAGVWNANHEDCSCSIIDKIDTFAEFATADAKQHRPSTLIDPFKVSFEANLEIFLSLCLIEKVTIELDLLIVPCVDHEIHCVVRWEEKEDAAGDVHLHRLDQLPKTHGLLVVVSSLVDEVDRVFLRVTLDDGDHELGTVDSVTVLQLDAKAGP